MHTISRFIRQQFLGALALAGLVVTLAGTATGATGDFLRLGAVNVADQGTRLRNAGDGPALQLLVEPGQPALGVSNSVLVPRLNAAMVGGRRASAFALATSVYSKADADAQFVASDAPRVLYYVGRAVFLDPPDEIVTVGKVRVFAPADGEITIRAEGLCSVSMGSMLLVTSVISAGTGHTYHDGYTGPCEAWKSAEVKAGQRVDAGASIASFPLDPPAAGSFSGIVEVVFQPK